MLSVSSRSARQRAKRASASTWSDVSKGATSVLSQAVNPMSTSRYRESSRAIVRNSFVRSWTEHTEAYADGSPSGGPFSSPKAHH
jgi:hypothetical protein